jgi:hypothetical protein
MQGKILPKYYISTIILKPRQGKLVVFAPYMLGKT